MYILVPFIFFIWGGLILAYFKFIFVQNGLQIF